MGKRIFFRTTKWLEEFAFLFYKKRNCLAPLEIPEVFRVGINSHPFGRAWSKIKEVVNIKNFYDPFPQLRAGLQALPTEGEFIPPSLGF
ncbi:MAG TPA: hypothetical protein ENJ95_01770 [Bacteroidetes bacterium]|nr:hypothetical protein [Bacteroidota bacterium]